jgi:hypothetical protein
MSPAQGCNDVHVLDWTHRPLGQTICDSCECRLLFPHVHISVSFYVDQGTRISEVSLTTRGTYGPINNPNGMQFTASCYINWQIESNKRTRLETATKLTSQSPQRNLQGADLKVTQTLRILVTYVLCLLTAFAPLRRSQSVHLGVKFHLPTPHPPARRPWRNVIKHQTTQRNHDNSG